MRYQLFSINNPLIIKIVSIGYAENPSVTRFNGQRDRFIVHYVLSGCGYFNGEKINAGKGFLITPNMQESYYPDKKDPWKFLWFIFDDPKAENFFNEYGADEKTHIFTFENLEILKETAQEVVRARDQRIDSTKLLEIFLRIFNSQKKKSATNHSSVDTYFDFSINYIHANLHTQITVNKLTELLGVSQPYLYSIFKEKTGVSPKQYIDELRIDKAKRLLNDTSLSITQIASSVGFPDVLSFSKFFSAREKQSPTNYRNT